MHEGGFLSKANSQLTQALETHNTHLTKAFLLFISFCEDAEVVLRLRLKPEWKD